MYSNNPFLIFSYYNLQLLKLADTLCISEDIKRIIYSLRLGLGVWNSCGR